MKEPCLLNLLPKMVSEHIGVVATNVMIAKAYITIAIRLRYDETTTHSTMTKVIEITICIRYNYDEKLMFVFCLRQIGSRSARYVVDIS